MGMLIVKLSVLFTVKSHMPLVCIMQNYVCALLLWVPMETFVMKIEFKLMVQKYCYLKSCDCSAAQLR